MDTWQQLCVQAFNGDADASQALLYLESRGRITPDGYIVTLSPDDYPLVTPPATISNVLSQLGFVDYGPPSNTQQYLLPATQWLAYQDIKRTKRTAWHHERQQQSMQKLNDALNEIHPLSQLTHAHRLALVSGFVKRFKTDVGCVPFFRGLVGFLRFQLLKHQLVDWNASEYIFTQNGLDYIEDYVRLMRGVLGMQVVSHSGQASIVHAVDMHSDSSDPTIVWRMNGDLSDDEIQEILHILPNGHGESGYTLSSGIREKHKVIVAPRFQKPLYIF